MINLFDEIYDLLDIAAKSFPLKALAGEIYTGQGTSKAESTLRGELNQQPGHKLGLVTALQIMKKTKDLRALDKIEEMFDRIAAAIPIGRPQGSPLRPIMELNADLIKEFGEELKALGNALKDGSIDDKETAVCLKELQHLIAACVRLETYLKHQFSVGATLHDFFGIKKSSAVAQSKEDVIPSNTGITSEVLHER
jgi:hypothetical protein